MAFVSSFAGARLLNHVQRREMKVRVSTTPKASDKKDSDGSFNFPRFNKRPRRDFEPFDGSMPLLPQWRPPSVEAEFNYSARRIVSRERHGLRPLRKLVKVLSKGYGTLFAEVVQEIEDGDGKFWLRPLLLDKDVDGQRTYVDLRGGSDLFLSKSRVSEVDEETKTRVNVNMMATESDLIDRAVSDESWDELGSHALIAFMRGISSNQSE